MKSVLISLVMMFGSVSFAQSTCKMLLSGEGSHNYRFTIDSVNESEAQEDALKAEIADVASLVNRRQLNLKSDQFGSLSENLLEKLYELKPDVEDSASATIKSNFNTVVLKSMMLMNLDDYQIGFITTPVQSLSISASDALDLLVETEIEDHYALLTMEFYGLASSEVLPEFRNIFMQVQSKDQLEVVVHSIFANKASVELMALVPQIQNSYQKEAFVGVIYNENISPGLMTAILTVKNKHQLEVLKVAFENMISEQSLYLEIIPEVTTDTQASNVIGMIKAKQFN